MDNSVILLDSDNELEKNLDASSFKLVDDCDDIESDTLKTSNIKLGYNSTTDNRQIKQKPRRQYNYVAVEENLKYEAEIGKIRVLSGLTPEHIEYMVLRDINYFIDIFSGSCDHSWRHKEFKKFSKRSGNLLYANSAMTSYTYEQYMSAVKALQSIFCKKDHKYDEYIVKVLLPEALIKICMRIYQCCKESAEDYLKKNNIKTCFKDYPQGSAIYSPEAKSAKGN